MATPLPATRADLHAQLLAVIEADHARSFALALRLMGNEADARDALQEAWVRAWRSRDEWRGEGNASAWLRTIVVRECMRSLKWRNLRRWLPFAGEEADVAAPSSASDTVDVSRIRLLARKLPPQQRIAFTLRFDEGWTVPEIAESLGVGPETVKTHLTRALHRVRAALGAQDDL